MKSIKKVLALALALAMVVTAVPVTNAEAATTGVPKTKTYYAGKTYTLKLTTPKSWKSVKSTWSEKSSAVSLSSKKAKSVKVKAIKAGSATVKVKVTYKKSSKKNAKKYTKNYSCKVSVKEPSIAVKGADVVAIGTTEKLTATVKPSTAKATFKSSDDTIATVDANGTVTGVKAGDVTITATAEVGTKTVTAEQKITVKKVILKEVSQTEVTKIVANIAGDTSNLKTSDFKVTNTATNATILVKGVSVDKTDKSKVTIEVYSEMKDAKEYSVVLDGVTKTFTATDGTAAKVGLTKTEVPAATKKEVKATVADANGVILGYFGLSDADPSKGKVTTALTITKGYVEGTEVYLPAVGDTMTAKVTYHTGTFGTDGKETGIIEDTFTITAVDPSIVNYGFAVTIAKNAPVWTATSFKANTSIKVGVDDQNAFFRITDDSGKDISNSDYANYSVETADPTKLVLNVQKLTSGNQTSVAVKGVSEGDTYILVKKDDKVVATLPVKVQGKSVATTADLNKTSVTVMSGASVSEKIEAVIKDQYGEAMKLDATPVVENLSNPAGTVGAAPTLTASNSGDNKKAIVEVQGINFATYKTGAYTYKITLKSGNKEVVRSFTVNYVANGNVQSYQLSVKPEVNTTIKSSTTTGDSFDFDIRVVMMANGAAISDYNNSNASGAGITTPGPVTYIIKDKDGKTLVQMGGNATTITNAAVTSTASLTNDKLIVSPVASSTTSDGVSYKKNLAAGTYYVTAKFNVDGKDVAVSGSFAVKDEQDTNVGIEYKNPEKRNDLGGTSVSTALANTSFVQFTYDGVPQSVVVDKVDSVKAGNTETVKSVDLYVALTGKNSLNQQNKVLITVPINQTFNNVAP